MLAVEEQPGVVELVDGFDGRIKQPLKAALLLIVYEEFGSTLPSNKSDCDRIFAGGAALAAMYLMARLT